MPKIITTFDNTMGGSPIKPIAPEEAVRQLAQYREYGEGALEEITSQVDRAFDVLATIVGSLDRAGLLDEKAIEGLAQYPLTAVDGP